MAGVQQPVQQVQAIGELMALRAQRSAHHLHRIELAGQRLDIGPVPHHQYRSQLAAVAGYLSRRDHDDALADRGQRGSGLGRGEHVENAWGQPDLVDAAAHVVSDLEQSARFVVDEGDASGFVGRQDTLADTVQHGRLGADQLGHLGRPQPQGQPAPAPGQSYRAGHTDQQRRAAQRGQHPQILGELLVERLGGDAHADHAQHPI
ncbi:hypothetical protein NIIDMKKI_32870 [Mycobacterium kansasii]|uniref:Uncharacterized protein n=1 Tax=Mycobacterium kansasii TaxID=1768 RepID=A0A7G1IAG6_MYCKA|nr:hypothetical protein NIIDMKKI_32870 [Mycobacterium kansasii]